MLVVAYSSQRALCGSHRLAAAVCSDPGVVICLVGCLLSCPGAVLHRVSSGVLAMRVSCCVSRLCV